MSRFHLHWGPPPPPHELPHHPWGHWGVNAEVQALAELLQRYVSPSDANWAADIMRLWLFVVKLLVLGGITSLCVGVILPIAIPVGIFTRRRAANWLVSPSC